MKKKLFALFGVAAMLGCGVAFGCTRPVAPVSADETTTETVECSVLLPTIEHITVKSSIDGGAVGDMVSLSIHADKLWVLDFQKLIVKVNGNIISKDTYEFSLVEGTNVVTLENVSVTALFPEPVQGIFASVLNGSFTWAMLLNPSTIIALISLIVSGGFGIGLLKVYSKYRAEKVITRESIMNALNKALPGACEQTIGGLVKDVISPLIAKVGNVEEAMTVFSRCFALVQENTPDSKLAILDELAKIKVTDNKLVEEVEKRIKEALELADKRFAEQMELLEKMKNSNAAAMVEKVGNTIVEAIEKDDGTTI